MPPIDPRLAPNTNTAKRLRQSLVSFLERILHFVDLEDCPDFD